MTWFGDVSAVSREPTVSLLTSCRAFTLVLMGVFARPLGAASWLALTVACSRTELAMGDGAALDSGSTTGSEEGIAA